MTNRRAVELSIVMPAHNEGANIDATVDEWYRGVVDRIDAAELIIVDDCSTDDTADRLAALAGGLPHLRVLRTPANAGHGPAVRFGLDRCRGEFVFQTDSDRQYAPEDFWTLWARRDDVDFVFGVRDGRADGRFRAAVSTALRGVNALLWQRWIADANCPFKLMRGSALARVLLEVPADTFIPMVMVSILARHRGFTVVDVPVNHFARRAGQQSLAGLWKWMRVGARCVRELAALRLAMTRRAPVPAASADA